jgi:hypothetical protein
MITKTCLISAGTIIYRMCCRLVNIHNFCCTVNIILQHVTDLKIYKNREILSYLTIRQFCNFGFYTLYMQRSINWCSIQINHQLDATISPVYYLTFIYSSACFRRPHAYHHELNNCSSSLWFYIRRVLIAVLSPSSNSKTGGCYCSC